MHNLSGTVLGTRKISFCVFLGFLGLFLREKSSFLHVPRTVLEKVSCFDTPCTAWYKRGRLWGISNTNLPVLVNQYFLVQKQNYKLASQKLTKRQVEAIQTCLPLLLCTPQSGLLHIHTWIYILCCTKYIKTYVWFHAHTHIYLHLIIFVQMTKTKKKKFPKKNKRNAFFLCCIRCVGTRVHECNLLLFALIWGFFRSRMWSFFGAPCHVAHMNGHASCRTYEYMRMTRTYSYISTRI